MKQYFEWDDNKEAINVRKHGVTFSVAERIFDDPRAITRQDRIENGEERWQTIGSIDGVSLLLVAHTLHAYQDGEYVEIIRIISARRADRKERKWYDNGSFYS